MDDLIAFAAVHPVPTVIGLTFVVLICFAGFKPWRRHP